MGCVEGSVECLSLKGVRTRTKMRCVKRAVEYLRMRGVGV